MTSDEQEQLFEILAGPGRAVSVNPGEEVIVTDDGAGMSFYSGQDGGGVGTPMSRMQAVLTYERACGADTTSLGHSDYSYKPVKPNINFDTCGFAGDADYLAALKAVRRLKTICRICLW